MNAFYRDVLNLDTLSTDDKSGRFKLGDGTEVHVYGQLDEDHDFFGGGPVVALEVDDFAVARARLLSAGIKFVYEEPQRASGKIWQHFIAPDGNVYARSPKCKAGPNPSIERTSSGKLRLPTAAAHVER